MSKINCPKKGKFIVVEGLDGSGKTSAIAALRTWFESASVPAVFTREPGGTVFAEACRQLLKSDLTAPVSHTAQALLFAAARRDHVERTIRPALADGYHVVCDRFTLSTRTYQHGTADLEEIIQIGSDRLEPDLHIILGVSFKTSQDRLAARAGNVVNDHLDSNDVAVFNQRRNVLSKFIEDNIDSSDIVVINADADMSVVHNDIIKWLTDYLAVDGT